MLPKCSEYLLVTVNRCKMKPAPANIYSPEVMAALRSRGGWTWAFHHQALFLICENVSSCSSVSRSCRYIIGGYLHVYLTCPCVCVYIYMYLHNTMINVGRFRISSERSMYSVMYFTGFMSFLVSSPLKLSQVGVPWGSVYKRYIIIYIYIWYYDSIGSLLIVGPQKA